ncbi:hypothetical protein PIROE2DRAFT_65561 [Piromyces sp. E2]|nr:hypothetical protein PIROE2DRAFT_65561 [Piromyces sp. E2]|eukprot:OUM56387.1 hypothetical protein PIROE2DRAFT_65561 [Piromyces sp. E2]
MVLNKSTFETIEKKDNNEEDITDNKDKVGFIEHFDKVENKDKVELKNNENSSVIPNDTINETLLQRNPSIISSSIPDLTISRYLDLFGYEESESDIDKILESSILRNEKTKINLIIRYAFMNDIVLFIDEKLLNNILKNKDKMSQLFIDYATKYDIILNVNNDKIINYNISPNIILKFIKNSNYELEDKVFDNTLENLDNTTETFPDCPYENNRDLDKIANLDIRIHRSIKTYHEFKMRHCNNHQIQFLSLIKNYNTLFDNNSQKIKIEEVIDDFDGKDKKLNFKIIENPEEIIHIRKDFFKRIMEMIFKYVIVKYGKTLDKKNNITKEMKNEFFNFDKMLVSGLTEETIFAKDIAEFSDKLNNNFNDYDPENILDTIYDILKYPVNIESGYVKAIKKIKELYFRFSENGEEPTKYKLNPKGNENNDTNVNQFDELCEVQKKRYKNEPVEVVGDIDINKEDSNENNHKE